ncbi:BlaI/MecI/CopY family transcriptional regulator [Candidatus Sumerlaeota bacterium]|nr:BlaI/MecI/CopY family transcriptional regulator [Candidatus Sumerlaeota bacterium]
MPNDLPELSRAEWLVMQACWEKRRATARDIHEEVSPRRGWEYQTVKTMLDRLTAKGYLKCGKVGPVCLFEPAVTRAKAIGRAIDTFKSTVLGDSLAPLFAHFTGGKSLSDEEIGSLRRLIEKHEED